MSRRYGRNQKRRAREEIASLTGSVAMANGLAKDLARRNDRLRDEIQRAKDLLPEGSVLFDPGEILLGGERQERVRHMPLELFNVESLDLMNAPIEPVEYRTIDLEVLLTDVMLDQLRDQLHFQVEFVGERWYYAISRQGLRRLGRRDLVATLSQNLAKQISADLARKGVL